ncbi:MAG TPA: hypothetical protein VHZ09_03670 [Acidobacteriaceae bacterium]|nr:hypothetical protein [Acidobacteriaceae bacterium]
MKLGYDRRIEKLIPRPGEGLQDAADRICRDEAHASLSCCCRGKSIPVDYEVFAGNKWGSVDHLIKLLHAAEDTCARTPGLVLSIDPSSASSVLTGQTTITFDSRWLKEHGDEADTLRTRLEEEEQRFPYSYSLAELKNFAAGAYGEDDPSGLLNEVFLGTLLREFAWWIDAADALLPILHRTGNSDTDGYLDPEFYPQRDRLLVLETEFWKELPIARRAAAWANNLAECCDEGLKQSTELLQRYFAYRGAVLELAGMVVSASLYAQLEARI